MYRAVRQWGEAERNLQVLVMRDSKQVVCQRLGQFGSLRDVLVGIGLFLGLHEPGQLLGYVYQDILRLEFLGQCVQNFLAGARVDCCEGSGRLSSRSAILQARVCMLK